MKRPATWVIATLLLATTSEAHAHLINTGLGPFYDGLTHLFVAPEDLLPVIAVALLGGLRGASFGRMLLFVLPVAWLAGSFAGRWVPASLTLPALTAAVTITLGVLVAIDRPLSLTLVAGCGILLGLLHGVLNGIEWAKLPLISGSRRGSRCRALCPRVIAGRTSDDGAGGLGACCGPRGRELDRRKRATHVGMVPARLLQLKKSIRSSATLGCRNAQSINREPTTRTKVQWRFTAVSAKGRSSTCGRHRVWDGS